MKIGKSVYADGKVAERKMELDKIAVILIAVSLLCFFSADYFNGNGQLGYKGGLFLFAKAQNRQFVYRRTNKIFGVLLFVGSVTFLGMSFGCSRLAVSANMLQKIRSAYLLYLFSAVMITEAIVGYQVWRRNRHSSK